MSVPERIPQPPEKEIDLDFLAIQIAQRFTPFAFDCNCNGSEPSCAMVLKDPYNLGVKDTIDKIAQFVREFKYWLCYECNAFCLSETAARVCARRDKDAHDAAYDSYHGDENDDE